MLLNKEESTIKCALGKALGCTGINADDTCRIYNNKGVLLRMTEGVCVFKNIRAPKVDINAPKTGKMRNPLKAAKTAARGQAASES